MPSIKTRLSPLHAALPFFVASLLLPAAAGAQDVATAEALFNKGLAEMKAGHYETGCKAIAESQRLDPRPGTLFTLAACETEWGHIATAASHYGEYLTVYERLPADKQAAQRQRFKVATETREKLLPEVPRLTLSLPKGAPAGTVVKRNGELVADAALDVELPVDPGEYVLTTEAPGGSASEQRVTMQKGEKKVVTLEVKAAAAPKPSASATAPPPPAGTGPSGLRIATYVTGGVGVAGLVVGAALGGVALGKKGVMDQHCGTGIGQADKTACDATGLDASNSAKSMALGSTIGLIAGGALAGAAVVMFLVEPKAPRNATPKTGAGPRSLSVGVLSAGPTGVSIGASGAF